MDSTEEVAGRLVVAGWQWRSGGLKQACPYGLHRKAVILRWLVDGAPMPRSENPYNRRGSRGKHESDIHSRIY